MSGLPITGPRRGLTLALLWLLLLAAPASRAELGSFYGRENIQFVEARYAPLVMTAGGANYELLFSFATSADRTETPGSTRLFHGASAGGGGFNWPDADIQDERRDAAAGYVVLLYQGYLFSDSSSDGRAYLNWSLGLGRGSFWADPAGEEDGVFTVMNLYVAGLRGGAEFRLRDQYFLDLGIGVDARSFVLDDEYRAAYPVMVTVGVSRWIGALKHDRLPER